jgi:predicted RNA-binding protein with PIN domain
VEQLLIVDGHSAIFGIEWLRELHHGAKRHLARHELVKALRDIGDRGEWKVCVVFDGRQTERSFEGGTEDGILIIYSKAKETADAVIERLAARFSEKGDRVMVATNDGMILLTATTFGAGGMRIEELERWIEGKEF